MAKAVVRLACEACGARYDQPLTVIREDTSAGVKVSVELDESAVMGWCAAHRAPVVIPTKACV